MATEAKARPGGLLRRVAGALFSLAFPPLCAGCGGRHGPDGETPLCDPCREGLPVIRDPACPRCGAQLGPYAQGRAACPVDHSGLLFRQAVAACRYDGVAAELVKGLKFRRDVRALDVMVPLLARRLAEAGVAERVDAVAPVPLHWLRRAGRRFNQAELIAEPLAETLRLRYERRALRRTRYTVPQVRLSPAERRVNLRGAFAVRDPAAVRDARVLLVDDVMTTCSTARECAQALREAGAQAVYVAVFARAQSFSQPPEVSTA